MIFSPVRKKKLLDPKLDYTFKLLFGSQDCEDLLVSLCTAILSPVSPIVSCKVLNPAFPKEYKSTKPIYLDVLIELEDRTLVNIEMQQSQWFNVITRGFYYWARVHNRQMKEGDHYDANTQTVVVFFLNYHDDHNTYSGLQNTLRVVDGDGNPVQDSPFRMDLIEIPRVIGHIEALTSGQVLSPLANWLMFFHDPDDKRLEEIMKSDPAIKKAKARLKVLSENEQNQVEALMREKAIGAWNLDRAMLERHTREKALKEGKEQGIEIGLEMGKEQGIEIGLEMGMEKGKEQGIEIGLEKGMEKGRADLLKSQVARWSKDGLTAVEIAKLADVTPSEIEALLSSLKDT